MTLPLDSVLHPDHAGTACRILIRAYAADPEYVDWSEVQEALAEALAAFGFAPDRLDPALA